MRTLALACFSFALLAVPLHGQQTRRSMPRYELTGGLSVVPNSATDVSTTNSYICQVSVANVTGGAVTFTVTDKASSAKTLIPTVSIPANTVIIMNWPNCVKMTSGISWTAGAATSLHAEIFGYKE